MKSNFKDQPKEFKEANKHYRQGELFFNERKYEDALKEYYIANKFNKNCAALNAKIGETFLKTAKKNMAHKYLATAVELNPQIDGYYIYLLAKSHHLHNEFDDATKRYKQAKSKGSKIYPQPLADISKYITECKNGKELVAKPDNIKLELLPGEINTSNQEYVPVINADESVMIFTSRRSETTGGQSDLYINDFYEDIYISRQVKGKWTAAQNIGAPVNSDRHDATVALSVDGQSLFIYRDNKKGDGDIYISTLEGKNWSEPEALPEPINSDAQETSACFSPDGNTIFFVSDRDGGKGGMDIYSSTKDKEGKWGPAKGISTLNTKYDEDAVFLHPDGKTFYFSSKGFNTMGGFDIFISEMNGKKWSKPKNIGYPINSSDDDVSIVITANGNHGYYTSIRTEGKGKRDIYRITFLDELDKPKLALLKGVILDKKTGEPIEAVIEIFDNANNKQVSKFKSNSATGQYMVSIPAGADYGIHVRAHGYMFHSDVIQIDSTHAFQQIENNIELQKLEVGTKIVLNNVFYDYGKASLRLASHNELDIIIELLEENPHIKIELSSHTDSRGSHDYNQNLSNKRAHSCVDYLMSKGVNKTRLVAKGYGEKDPLYSDADIKKEPSEEEQELLHQHNRRTEFKIIES
ncbi:MAG: PD40 domain-containing protein [Flavobacteriales bacterium]|nr:PD40 domain-containing protein [Flavobacteriales bacterium]